MHDDLWTYGARAGSSNFVLGGSPQASASALRASMIIGSVDSLISRRLAVLPKGIDALVSVNEVGWGVGWAKPI